MSKAENKKRPDHKTPVRKSVRKRQEENRAKRAERRHKEEMLVRCIAAGVVATAVVVCVLVFYAASYAKAAGEYNSISRSYVQGWDIPWVEQPLKENEPIEGSDSPSEVAEDEAGTDTAPLYPPLTIDHEGLRAANSDYVAWIYVPGCETNYPIVKGSDNEYYLDHTFEGNTSSGGAIFMDHRDDEDLFSFNTFIYGHNMKDGSMFGKLKRYLKDDGLIEQYPFFYVYTPDGFIRKYRIFSYYTTDGNAECYDRPEDVDGETAYLRYVRTHAVVQGLPYTSEYDCYMTLSTCHGSSGSGGRFVVHGVLTEMLNN